jgi:hypothetical protein
VLRQAAEYAESRCATATSHLVARFVPVHDLEPSTAALAWPPGNNNPLVTQLVAIAAEVHDHKANAGHVPGTAAKTAPPPPPPATRRTSCPSGNVCPVDDFAQPLVVSIAVSPGDVPPQAALAFACVVSSISRVASAGGIGRQLGLGGTVALAGMCRGSLATWRLSSWQGAKKGSNHSTVPMSCRL